MLDLNHFWVKSSTFSDSSGLVTKKPGDEGVLVNQMVAICNITRAYIVDVMLYSTGAIAASALCQKALEFDAKYVWTRCDYHPKEFVGGYVHFKRPMVCAYPMIVDFVSMYPSIMSSALISPESIDYLDFEHQDIQRYDKKVVLLSYTTSESRLAIGMTMYGYRVASDSGCQSILLIGKHCSTITCSEGCWTYVELEQVCSRVASSVVLSWSCMDKFPTSANLECIDILRSRHFGNSTDRVSLDWIPNWALDQCRAMSRHTLVTGQSGIWEYPKQPIWL